MSPLPHLSSLRPASSKWICLNHTGRRPHPTNSWFLVPFSGRTTEHGAVLAVLPDPGCSILSYPFGAKGKRRFSFCADSNGWCPLPGPYLCHLYVRAPWVLHRDWAATRGLGQSYHLPRRKRRRAELGGEICEAPATSGYGKPISWQKVKVLTSKQHAAKV